MYEAIVPGMTKNMPISINPLKRLNAKFNENKESGGIHYVYRPTWD